MFRTNVNCQPCPQEIQPGVDQLHIPAFQRRQQLLQHFINGLVIV